MRGGGRPELQQQARAACQLAAFHGGPQPRLGAKPTSCLEGMPLRAVRSRMATLLAGRGRSSCTMRARGGHGSRRSRQQVARRPCAPIRLGGRVGDCIPCQFKGESRHAATPLPPLHFMRAWHAAHAPPLASVVRTLPLSMIAGSSPQQQSRHEFIVTTPSTPPATDGNQHAATAMPGPTVDRVPASPKLTLSPCICLLIQPSSLWPFSECSRGSHDDHSALAKTPKPHPAAQLGVGGECHHAEADGK